MVVFIVAASVFVLAGVLFLWWFAAAWAPAGRKVTVSLADGSVLTGRTRGSWPGRIRLVEVEALEGEVPGVVVVNGAHVLTVQVIG